MFVTDDQCNLWSTVDINNRIVAQSKSINLFNARLKSWLVDWSIDWLIIFLTNFLISGQGIRADPVWDEVGQHAVQGGHYRQQQLGYLQQ